MVRYQVILAYDGTLFKGFQRQARARTVQGVVEAALRELGWSGKAILAAGRTDTGVHANGQVIAFDLDWRHEPEELQKALNARLPEDVSAQSVRVVEANFNPRYAAVNRAYRYSVYCAEVRQPLLDGFAWRVWPPPDLQRLQEAAKILEGTHDFAAFGTPPRVGGSTLRTVFQANWNSTAEGLVFEICANAFLYHMVRRLVSYLVEIGQGRRQADELVRCLEMPLVAGVQGLAPPQGLTLLEVTFADQARISRKNLDEKPPGVNA
jgi:tRNA pseudouridine38-40 synthase